MQGHPVVKSAIGRSKPQQPHCFWFSLSLWIIGVVDNRDWSELQYEIESELFGRRQITAFLVFPVSLVFATVVEVAEMLLRFPPESCLV